MQKSSTQLTLVQYRRSFWNNEIADDQCDEYERLITDPESLDISRDREIAVNSKAFDSTNPITFLPDFVILASVIEKMLLPIVLLLLPTVFCCC